MKNKNRKMESRNNSIKMKTAGAGIESQHRFGAFEKIKKKAIEALLSAAGRVVLFQDMLETFKKSFIKILWQSAGRVVLFQDMLALAAAATPRGKKLQGSIEYIMILSAVTIIVVIALSMMTQLKGAVLHSFYNTSNQSGAQLLSSELKNLSNI